MLRGIPNAGRTPEKEVGEWAGNWGPVDSVQFKAVGCVLGVYGGQGLGAGF